MDAVVGIFIGYFLGAVSPAYFLGRIIKKVDIRTIGTKNAGTTNVFRELGLWPAIITAIYDLAKGLAAMAIAYYLLHLSLPFIYGAGLAAIVGHIFPFYLSFRGGEGSATGVAILIFILILLLKNSLLPLSSIVVLGGTVGVIYAITRKKGYMGLVALPVVFFLIFKHYSFTVETVTAGLIIMLLFFNNAREAHRDDLFVLKEETRQKTLVWRTLLRPLAIVFPIAYFFIDRTLLLWIVGIIGVVPTLFDLIRLSSSKINIFFFTKEKRVLKQGEEKRFSSVSLFLISAFLTIIFFPKEIAICAMAFLIFGDVFAKFFGLEFGEIKLLQDKTLEGSMGHLLACALAGYILWPYTGLNPATIAIGALTATVAEALPLGVNDNFSVALLSAGVMLILSKVVG
jgi:glycerol-3-phosphate acyltransferase PlsY